MDSKCMQSWVDALNTFESANVPYAIATVVRIESPSSARAGDKAVITPEGDIFGWIGGGCTQPVVTKAVKDALDDGSPLMVKISPSTGKTVTKNGVREVHMACHSGGSIELLIEPRLAKYSVLVIGSTPVADKLESVAPVLSIPLRRLDPGQHVDDHFRCAVVATQGNKDKNSLVQAIRHTSGIVYFVASQKKAAKIKQQLMIEGLTSAEIDRIRSPAGLEIHAETTAEIAVSILASVIKDNREGPSEMPMAGEQSA